MTARLEASIPIAKFFGKLNFWSRGEGGGLVSIWGKGDREGKEKQSGEGVKKEKKEERKVKGGDVRK